MELPGKYLKAERELRNLSLEEIAKFTKIKEDFLKAIEEDRYELLPPAIYVKGFLTIYARYLGLNPYDVVHRYQKYLEDISILKKQMELPQQIPPTKMRVRPWFPFVPIFAIILCIALFIYYTCYTSHKPSKRVPSALEEESTSVPLPSIPSPLPGQGKTEIQITHQAAKKEISKPKEAETKGSIRSESSPFEVLEAGIGSEIEKEGGFLVLRGKCSEFTCNNQRVYFFTRIKAQREGKIVHVWLWKGEEFNRIEINVKPPVWSVYSYITLRPQHAGSWKAEVRDGDNVLKSLSFKATEAPDR
jgi:transcriptional regulator with XRE-family HTH domain